MQMTEIDKEKIKKILSSVRELCETMAKLSKNDSDLNGYCFIASDLICQKIIKETSLLPDLIIGSDHPSGHCWVELGGYILDVTLTQFNCHKKVYFSKKAVPSAHYWPEMTRYSYQDDRELISEEMNQWDEIQRPLWHQKDFSHLKSFTRESVGAVILKDPKKFFLAA